VPGERLVGVWLDEGSIAVHAIDCAAWARSDPPEADILDIGWRRDGDDVFAFTGILVTVRNEIGVLSEVAAVIARYGVSIANISMRNHSADFVDMFIEIEVKSDRQIAQLLAGLCAVSTVVAAERCEAKPDE
jgi:(p)ppGpp synthase/HD superfamily hydrolase